MKTEGGEGGGRTDKKVSNLKKGTNAPFLLKVKKKGEEKKNERKL